MEKGDFGKLLSSKFRYSIPDKALSNQEQQLSSFTGEEPTTTAREMAFHLSSSPSALFGDHHSHVSRDKPGLRNFFCPFYLVPASPHQCTSPLHVTQVSLDEPISKQLHNPVATEDAHGTSSDANSGSSSKNYVWVNPRSPRASRLRHKSYESRYVSLVNVAETLDSLEPKEKDVVNVLSGIDGGIVEQDAVIILNNMSNCETASLALKFFMKELKTSKEVILYNVTMKVFRKCKDMEGAEKLFDELLKRKIKPDIFTFSTLISCARMCSFPNKAVEWFEKMQTFGCEPDNLTYSSMIDAYGRAGNAEMAFSLYDRARTEKWRIDPSTFTTLIKIHGVAGNYDGCLNVYEDMKAIGVKPNLGIYNSLIDAMGRAKRPWQAKNIYKEMTKSGITPSWVTYASLLRAYGRARYGHDALNVYKEMKGKGLELNVVLYNIILATCADVAYIDEGIEIFEDMKGSKFSPDSWTYSCMVTIYACNGDVSKAEGMLNEMTEAGIEPNIFILTSLIQCYGKANLTNDVVRIFNLLVELGITPDERFCGCLLNVITQTPKEELYKVVDCVEKANSKLGHVVKLLVGKKTDYGNFKAEASELFTTISPDVKKAYCNCLIDLSVNLNLLEKACELLDLGLSIQIYKDLQSKSETQWSLYLKGLSLGAALTALHVWINDLSKEMESGAELPALLGINTGHGKHKYSDKGLAGVFESHLKELNAPFHEAPDKVGWFLTTRVAAESWLESRNSPESAATATAAAAAAATAT